MLTTSHQWVIDFLVDEEGISSIKSELIPHLVNSQGFGAIVQG